MKNLIKKGPSKIGFRMRLPDKTDSSKLAETESDLVNVDQNASVKIRQKSYDLPIYLTDATRAVTKSIDSEDLKNSGVRGVVVNTYHLLTDPGIDVLKKAGGIKKFMNFNGLVVSDSGGWQVFSLIHRSNTQGKITDEGVFFTINNSKKEIFTPEKSIQTQFEIGSDIIICLDDFTPPDSSEEAIKNSVRRTIHWAKRCKLEYQKQLKARKLTDRTRPHLYAVIQGGYSYDQRRFCAEELICLDFDGYGYGGYAVDDTGVLDYKLSEFIANLIPDNKIKFALGVGKPQDIVKLAKMGWQIFDCTLPTRDARHERLYIFNQNPKNIEKLASKTAHAYLYISRDMYKADFKPISRYCDCLVCQRYSRAYLRHLFKIKDTSAYRLATLHNLRIYSLIIENLQKFLTK